MTAICRTLVSGKCKAQQAASAAKTPAHRAQIGNGIPSGCFLQIVTTTEIRHVSQSPLDLNRNNLTPPALSARRFFRLCNTLLTTPHATSRKGRSGSLDPTAPRNDQEFQWAALSRTMS